MEPLLPAGRTVIVLKGIFSHSIHRGDIVVYKSPVDGSAVIKRCKAVGGELPVPAEQEIPKGFFYAVGENNEVSVDSRYYGPVNKQELIGKVIFPLIEDEYSGE